MPASPPTTTVQWRQARRTGKLARTTEAWNRPSVGNPTRRPPACKQVHPRLPRTRSHPAATWAWATGQRAPPAWALEWAARAKPPRAPPTTSADRPAAHRAHRMARRPPLPVQAEAAAEVEGAEPRAWVSTEVLGGAAAEVVGGAAAGLAGLVAAAGLAAAAALGRVVAAGLAGRGGAAALEGVAAGLAAGGVAAALEGVAEGGVAAAVEEADFSNEWGRGRKPWPTKTLPLAGS